MVHQYKVVHQYKLFYFGHKNLDLISVNFELFIYWEDILQIYAGRSSLSLKCFSRLFYHSSTIAV